MPTIHRTRQSDDDIVEIGLYVRRQNAAAADRLVDAIDATLQFLAEDPMAGPSREELGPALRSLPVNQYTR